MDLKSFASQSAPGPFLKINEDACEFDFTSKLYMIFDGFGGSGIGDIAVTNLKKNLKNFFLNLNRDPNSTLPFFYSPKYLLEANVLINAMLYSHDLLLKENYKKDLSKRAGASSILMTQSEEILTVISVGNCCVYLERAGELNKILVEDNYYYLGDDSHDAHLRLMPMSGFGLFPDLYYQVKEVRINSGDKIIAMTDGAYGHLGQNEILNTINSNSLDLDEKINKIFELSNKRGNLDNQSVMILEF